MENKRILLPTEKFENALPEELQIRIGLEEDKNILKNTDRDIVLDLSEQFNKERQECNRFKIHGKVKMLFRNLYSGTTTYEPLKNTLFYNGDGEDLNFSGYLPYNEFAFLRNDIYREVVNVPEVDSLTGFTGVTLTISGDTSHVRVTPLNYNKFNWNLYLSYVYDHTKTIPLKYTLSGNTKVEGQNIINFNCGDGIPFRVQDDGVSYKLTSPVKHGIQQGEYIIINSKPYYVNSIGDEYYNSEFYVLSISKTQIPSNITFNTLVTGKRCLDVKNITGSTCQYYIHKHKIITTENDYIFDKLGFETQIFEDEKKLITRNSRNDQNLLVEQNIPETIFFDFPKPIILTGLTNNLNYEPTEVYLTFIYKNSNGYFNYPPKLGYSFHLHNTWIDDHFSGTTSNETNLKSTTFTRTVSGTTFTFNSGNTLNINDFVYGGFIEYDPINMKERVISNSYHKLTNNTITFNYGQTNSQLLSGASINNPFGILYQPHYKVKLKDMSPYIETSPTNDIYNLPKNAKYFENEKLWKWRDIYDYGYIDTDGYGVDYPYANNLHYIKQDVIFAIKNEKLFKNKQDGLNDFNKTNNNTPIC